jgi:hypothetical protein
VYASVRAVLVVGAATYGGVSGCFGSPSQWPPIPARNLRLRTYSLADWLNVRFNANTPKALASVIAKNNKLQAEAGAKRSTAMNAEADASILNWARQPFDWIAYLTMLDNIYTARSLNFRFDTDSKVHSWYEESIRAIGKQLPPQPYSAALRIRMVYDSEISDEASVRRVWRADPTDLGFARWALNNSEMWTRKSEVQPMIRQMFDLCFRKTTPGKRTQSLHVRRAEMEYFRLRTKAALAKYRVEWQKYKPYITPDDFNYSQVATLDNLIMKRYGGK